MWGVVRQEGIRHDPAEPESTQQRPGLSGRRVFDPATATTDRPAPQTSLRSGVLPPLDLRCMGGSMDRPMDRLIDRGIDRSIGQSIGEVSGSMGFGAIRAIRQQDRSQASRDPNNHGGSGSMGFGVIRQNRNQPSRDPTTTTHRPPDPWIFLKGCRPPDSPAGRNALPAERST